MKVPPDFVVQWEKPTRKSAMGKVCTEAPPTQKQGGSGGESQGESLEKGLPQLCSAGPKTITTQSGEEDTHGRGIRM